MSINVGQVSHPLSDGLRFYAYSGIVQGGIAVPASVTLISIPNTGLKDTFVKIQNSYGLPVTTGFQDALGISILIDDVEVIKQQSDWNLHYTPQENQMVISLFIIIY